MIDAVIGGVIIVVATSSLLMALEVAQKAFDQAGRYPLTANEKEILEGVGIGPDPANLQNFFLDNIQSLPRDDQ